MLTNLFLFGSIQGSTHADISEVMHTLLRTVIQSVVYMYLDDDTGLIVSLEFSRNIFQSRYHNFSAILVLLS